MEAPYKTHRILYLEDEQNWVDSLQIHLDALNGLSFNTKFSVKVEMTRARTVEEFLGILGSSEDFELALIDLNIKDQKQQGPDLLRILKRKGETIPRVVLTAESPRLTIYQALDYGIHEYYEKTILTLTRESEDANVHQESIGSFIETLFDLPSRYNFQEERQRFGLQEDEIDLLNEMVGDSLEILKVKAQIASAARSSLPVLITGESGTGKEKAAYLVHKLSDRGRSNYDWVPLNCAEYTSDLLRSELLGHVKGAFTGAQIDKKGLLEQADKSTLFLDEVGHADQLLQSSLLRALSEGKARKVGASDEYAFNTRLIAATDQPLFESGHLQESFLNRISGLLIHIPPLRERKTIATGQKSDFEKLALTFANSVAKNTTVTFTPPAIMALHTHDWPGNVREMKHVVTSVVSDAMNRFKYKGKAMPPKISIDGAQVRWQISQSTARVRDRRTSPADPFSNYLGQGHAYRNVERRFLAHYVHHVHESLCAGERTTGAYDKTALFLDASVSFVKQRLADYRELFGEEGLE